MSSSKKQPLKWRRFQEQALARADKHDKTAKLNRLVAMADDPLDGLAAVMDVVTLSMHNAAARIAQRHGRVPPTPPVPVSRLLSRFMQQLRDKSIAIIMHLRSDEAERLARLQPGFATALEANDADVMVLIRNLLPRDPEVIALWLCAHLDILEQRFAP